MQVFANPSLGIKRASRLYFKFFHGLHSFFSYFSLHRILLSAALLSCGRHFRPGRYIDIMNPGRVSIGNGFSTGSSVKIHAWIAYRGIPIDSKNFKLVEIGNNVFINDNSYITSAYGVTIGDNCLLGSNVLITDNSHGKTCTTKAARISLPLESKGTVVIGSNVWICNNVVITSGLYIGDNSIIAANSVVTCDVPAGALFGGVPARCLKIL